MGLTISDLTRHSVGNEFEIRANAVWNAVYAQGGASLTPAMLGLMSISHIPPIFKSGYMMEHIPSTEKLMARRSAATTGIAALHQFGFADAKGATALIADNATTDMASDVVNANILSTYAAVSTLVAGAMLIALQPDVPRNIQINIKNDSGGPLNLYEGTTSFAIVGTFRGAAQTETLTWTSTSGNKTVATAKYRALGGVKPFDTITSITVTNLPAATLKIGAGFGSKIGLPIDPINNLETDLIKLMVTGTDVAISGQYNTTNKTVGMLTTADNWDFFLEYNIAGATAQAALAEVTNGVTLSTTPGSFVIVARGLGW
jgi:hypothetical protein